MVNPPSINPYEVTALSAPSAPPPSPASPPIERQFQIRMHWSDRRRFLAAVGPLRVAAVAGAVIIAIGAFSLATNLANRSITGALGSYFDPINALHFGFLVLKGSLLAFGCLTLWRFADVLAATAGGRSNSMNQWSHLQLLLARLVVALVALNAASIVIAWLIIEYIRRTMYHS